MTTTNKPDLSFIEATTTTNLNDSRKLAHTNQLIDVSRAKAQEVIKAISLATPDVRSQMVSQLNSGDYTELTSLMTGVITEDIVKADSTFLADCSADEFSKLLESRRSDRSKKLKDGPTKSMTNLIAYLGAVYAEMLIRLAWNKPYAPGTSESEVDTNDLDAISRKIKSLQSKQCRLNKTAPYNAEDAKALEGVKLEISRLQSFRPTVATKTTIKSAPVETLRKALEQIDKSKLDTDTLDKLQKAGLL